MGNDNGENYIENVDYPSATDTTDNNRNKIRFLGNNENRIYNTEHDNNLNPTKVFNNTSLNPFAVAIDMWQNYVNIWNETFKQLSFRNLPMVSNEFLFIYWKSSSDKSEDRLLS